MKNILYLSFTIILTTICFQEKLYAQLIRGANNNEIYLYSWCFVDNNWNEHEALFYSDDNGENLCVQYSNIVSQTTKEMQLGYIYDDANQGTVYNVIDNDLWVSFDKGITWQQHNTFNPRTQFFSGLKPGNIIIGNLDGLFKSTDYGISFQFITNEVTCPFKETGFLEGEFFGVYGVPGNYFNFVHTLDYGQTFTEDTLDPSIALWAPASKRPEIARGAIPGELYLMSWDLDYHYSIFHSQDNGNSWTKKIESDYIDIFSYGVSFTAGSEPGSVYIRRSILGDDYMHIDVYLDYSNDYGATFKTYFHSLDSTTITNVDENYPVLTEKFSCHPNPVNTKTSYCIPTVKENDNSYIIIRDISGKMIKTIPVLFGDEPVWDLTDEHNNIVPQGIYIASFFIGEESIATTKTVVLR